LKHKTKIYKYIIILLGLILAIAVPLIIRALPQEPKTRVIKLVAKKYGYSPERIVVNRGDTLIIKPTSQDVTHGFYLDGYPVEFIIKQQGVAFQKYTWKEDDGKTQTDWDRVSEIEFTADKAGKFIFRCTQTCGNLHPFMTGEIVVRPNTPYHLVVSLSLWVVLSVFLLYRNRSGKKEPTRVNLFERFPRLQRLMKLRGFHFFVILPNLIVFYLFILSALWGSPVGNRNIAIIFVWILWWFVLKSIVVPLGGRLWCMVCPLPAPAEWLGRMRLTAVRYIQKPFKGLHHRFFGLQKDWPKALRNIWLQNILFLAMISFGIILITRPAATAIMFLAILAMTFLLGVIFRHRVFCLYMCPVGGFLGTYSSASATALRAVDPEVCRKHKEKCCYTGGEGGWACPWNQYIGTMDRNNSCGFCTECIKSCPKDNIGLFIRPFGSDRVLKGYDEMFNVLIMLAVAIAFSITMLGPWGFIKEAANVTESGKLIPYFIYIACIWSAALLVFPGMFMGLGRLSNRLAGMPTDHRNMTLRLSYSLIPVGIFAWIAFSLPSVMINYNYILGVLSDPLGLGWDLFGTADFPFAPFYPEWIPAIQGVILLWGLYFGISRGFMGLDAVIDVGSVKIKAMLLPALFAFLIVQILMKLYLG
jgi:heme/copper-type cytochrome/quinol oxidase subunit 2